MARRQYDAQPWKKNLEVYQNFSGGMNTTSAQDNMANHELSEAINASLDERGSVTRRSGMIAHVVPTIMEGQAQGFFRYYKDAYSFEEIIAKDGKIEIDGTIRTIEGLESGFQTDRPIEAVQYYDKMYFATGTKLVQYDGTTLSVVEPYKPQPLEALYIGTNGISDKPNEYLDNGIGGTLQITGVIFSSRYGVMNEPFTMKAYHIKKEEDTIEYQFEYRYSFMEDGKYHMGQAWSEDNEWTFTAEGEGDMQFRINARVKGTEVATAQYLVPQYTVKPAPDPNDIEPDLSGIHTCNRIMLHWDRIILYGDMQNFNTVHFSHLKNPAYFPVPNNLRFETTANEPITKVSRFRDYLVVFTDTSTQALFGKGPQDFRRVVLNSSVGCIAPNSVAVMDNYVAFLSLDGVYILKSIGYVDDKANVSKLDEKISNLMPKDRNACAVVFEDQYHLAFPDRKERFRYYKTLEAWVKDESPHMDITSFSVRGVELYGQLQDGTVVHFKDNVYKDLDFIFPTRITTKYFDFGQPYHRKKLKELHLTASSIEKEHAADLKLFIDGRNNITDIVSHKVKFEPTETYNMFVSKVRITGSCLRAKVQIEHTIDDYIKIVGMSFVLKEKKP